jgi:hypothetical protein
LRYIQGENPTTLHTLEYAYLNETIVRAYEPKKQVALFTVCSYAKPYSMSFIHTDIRQALLREGLLEKIDYIHVSNAGIIPHEAERWYPAVAYDWNNEHIKDDPLLQRALRLQIKDRLVKFLGAFDGSWPMRRIWYFRTNSNTYKVVMEVLSDMPDRPPRFLGERAITRDDVINAQPEIAPALIYQFQMLHGFVDPDAALVLPANLTELVNVVKESLVNVPKE